MVTYSKKAIGRELPIGCLIVSAYIRICLGIPSLFLIDGIEKTKDPLVSKYSVSIGAIIRYNPTRSSSNSEICSPFIDIDGF